MFTCIGYYKGKKGYCHIYINTDYDNYNGDYVIKDEISLLFLVHKDSKEMVADIVKDFQQKKQKDKMVSYYKGLLKSELGEEFERLKKLGVIFGIYFDKIKDRLVLDSI